MQEKTIHFENKEAILKQVELNKKGLYGSVELFNKTPRVENSLCLIHLFNDETKLSNDFRFLNASLKLVDAVLKESSLSDSTLSFLCEEIKKMKLLLGSL